jgi:hypothetical protein
VLIPQLLQLVRRPDAHRLDQHVDRPPPPLVCPCHRHVDSYGDHIHTCKKHTGSTKDARETLEKICYDSGLSTQRHNIPSVQKANGKTGRCDLLIKSFIWCTVRNRERKTGISEASKRVSSFSFATQGGKQVSFYFRQGNWVQAREAQIRFPAG